VGELLGVMWCWRKACARRHDGAVLAATRTATIGRFLRTASDLFSPDIQMLRIVDITTSTSRRQRYPVASMAFDARIAVGKMESKDASLRWLATLHISRSAEGSASPYAIGIASSPCGSAREGTRWPD